MEIHYNIEGTCKAAETVLVIFRRKEKLISVDVHVYVNGGELEIVKSYSILEAR